MPPADNSSTRLRWSNWNPDLVERCLFAALAGSFRPSFGRLQVRAGQIEVMSHVRKYVRYLKPNLGLAYPADWKHISADRQNFVCAPMFHMSDAVDSGDRHHLSRFISPRAGI
jgi:hypothetical protein